MKHLFQQNPTNIVDKFHKNKRYLQVNDPNFQLENLFDARFVLDYLNVLNGTLTWFDESTQTRQIDHKLTYVIMNSKEENFDYAY